MGHALGVSNRQFFGRESDGTVRLRIRFSAADADLLEQASLGTPVAEWITNTLRAKAEADADAIQREIDAMVTAAAGTSEEPQVLAAKGLMELKGLAGFEPTRIDCVEDRHVWYVYFALDDAEVEIEVTFEEQAGWNAVISVFKPSELALEA